MSSESAGQWIRFPDLRPTYATRALQAGITVKIVSARLGHANFFEDPGHNPPTR